MYTILVIDKTGAMKYRTSLAPVFYIKRYLIKERYGLDKICDKASFSRNRYDLFGMSDNVFCDERYPGRTI